MCQFVSWIEFEGKNYFIKDEDLKTKEGIDLRKYLGPQFKNDIKGHGACDKYFDLKGKGEHKECTDFSTPKNFPKEIVNAIKQGKLIKIGYNLSLLNDKGKAKYKEIQQSAWAKYKEIQQSAWAKYEEIEQSAWAKYKEIQQPAWAKYKEIQQPAWAKYEEIQQPAWAKYKEIQQSAWAKYKEIQQSAWAKYKEIQQPAFWKLFAQKKYRNKNWL